jgi:hypothetical protein
MSSYNLQRPLFSVGERVKLVSKSRPDCRGEFYVTDVLADDEPYIDRLNNKEYITGATTFCYRLDQSFKALEDDGECIWAEHSLRKIYDSGEYSFDELMNVLKSPIVVNV